VRKAGTGSRARRARGGRSRGRLRSRQRRRGSRRDRGRSGSGQPREAGIAHRDNVRVHVQRPRNVGVPAHHKRGGRVELLTETVVLASAWIARAPWVERVVRHPGRGNGVPRERGVHHPPPGTGPRHDQRPRSRNVGRGLDTRDRVYRGERVGSIRGEGVAMQHRSCPVRCPHDGGRVHRERIALDRRARPDLHGSSRHRHIPKRRRDLLIRVRGEVRAPATREHAQRVVAPARAGERHAGSERCRRDRVRVRDGVHAKRGLGVSVEVLPHEVDRTSSTHERNRADRVGVHVRRRVVAMPQELRRAPVDREQIPPIRAESDERIREPVERGDGGDVRDERAVRAVTLHRRPVPGDMHGQELLRGERVRHVEYDHVVPTSVSASLARSYVSHSFDTSSHHGM